MLVATDIAARGIDVDGITHVINYEIPNMPESYVHRIGRTARAGASGTALSFCGPEERGYLRDIERVTRRTLTVVKDHPFIAAPGLAANDAEAPQEAPRGKQGKGGRNFRRQRRGRRPNGGHGGGSRHGQRAA